MRQYGYPSCTHRGVLLSPGEAVVVAAVASLQPAGSCRDALARMLRREMALAAAAGRRRPGWQARSPPRPPRTSRQEPRHCRNGKRPGEPRSPKPGRARLRRQTSPPRPGCPPVTSCSRGWRASCPPPTCRLAFTRPGRSPRAAIGLGRCAADLSAFQTLAQLPGPDAPRSGRGFPAWPRRRPQRRLFHSRGRTDNPVLSIAGGECRNTVRT